MGVSFAEKPGGPCCDLQRHHSRNRKNRDEQIGHKVIIPQLISKDMHNS